MDGVIGRLWQLDTGAWLEEVGHGDMTLEGRSLLWLLPVSIFLPYHHSVSSWLCDETLSYATHSSCHNALSAQSIGSF